MEKVLHSMITKGGQGKWRGSFASEVEKGAGSSMPIKKVGNRKPVRKKKRSRDLKQEGAG